MSEKDYFVGQTVFLYRSFILGPTRWRSATARGRRAGHREGAAALSRRRLHRRARDYILASPATSSSRQTPPRARGYILPSPATPSRPPGHILAFAATSAHPPFTSLTSNINLPPSPWLLLLGILLRAAALPQQFVQARRRPHPPDPADLRFGLKELREKEGKSVAVVEEINDSQNRRSLGVEALHVAAYYGKQEMCEFLIKDLNLDVNASAQHGASISS